MGAVLELFVPPPGVVTGGTFGVSDVVESVGMGVGSVRVTCGAEGFGSEARLVDVLGVEAVVVEVVAAADVVAEGFGGHGVWSHQW